MSALTEKARRLGSNRVGEGSGGRLPTRSRSYGVIAALLLALSLTAACGGEDKPDPIPSSDPTPEVSVSPPPDDAADLNKEQQAAMDDAVKVYDAYVDFSYEAGTNPGQDPKPVARELVKYTVMSVTDQFSESLDQLRANNARTEGSPEGAWTSPVDVDLESDPQTVSFMRCNTPGDWALIHEDGERIEQEENTIRNVVMVNTDRGWRVKKAIVDQEETC